MASRLEYVHAAEGEGHEAALLAARLLEGVSPDPLEAIALLRIRTMP